MSTLLGTWWIMKMFPQNKADIVLNILLVPKESGHAALCWLRWCMRRCNISFLTKAAEHHCKSSIVWYLLYSEVYWIKVFLFHYGFAIWGVKCGPWCGHISTIHVVL